MPQRPRRAPRWNAPCLGTLGDRFVTSDLTGKVLGQRYRILRVLGRGGMGAVYEAIQENLGRRVAIKVLLDGLSHDPDLVERFRREADAAGRLMHPHIVQVTDFLRSRGEPAAIVMELLDGEPLLAVLQRGPLPIARACRIAVQLLSALAAAHDAGIVHRDLKPANVFLVPLAGGDEYVKLLDFGIAKLAESDGYQRLTQSGVLLGTPRYAAPEQMLSRTMTDARTDLYSVGVLLYSMLAGRPPFTSHGGQLLIEIQDHEPPDVRTFVPSLSAGLAEVVHRAMRKRPSERFATAREMSAAIEPYLAIRHAEASDATSVSRTPEPTEAPSHATATRTVRIEPASLPVVPPTVSSFDASALPQGYVRTSPGYPTPLPVVVSPRPWDRVVSQPRPEAPPAPPRWPAPLAAHPSPAPAHAPSLHPSLVLMVVFVVGFAGVTVLVLLVIAFGARSDAPLAGTNAPAPSVRAASAPPLSTSRPRLDLSYRGCSPGWGPVLELAASRSDMLTIG
ncbi:MAG: serine/threonine-protein kinase, partial [Sandaracinaceae bacterium]